MNIQLEQDDDAEQEIKTWREFFELMDTIDVPEDFMADRPLNRPPVERSLFDELDDKP